MNALTLTRVHAPITTLEAVLVVSHRGTEMLAFCAATPGDTTWPFRYAIVDNSDCRATSPGYVTWGGNHSGVKTEAKARAGMHMTAAQFGCPGRMAGGRCVCLDADLRELQSGVARYYGHDAVWEETLKEYALSGGLAVVALRSAAQIEGAL